MTTPAKVCLYCGAEIPREPGDETPTQEEWCIKKCVETRAPRPRGNK